MKKVLLGVALVVVLTACHSSEKSNGDDLVEGAIDKPTEVKAKPIVREVFHYELVSNGTITAQQKAELKFKVSGIVTHVFVKNGNRVVKGQKLASIDDYELKYTFDEAESNLYKANLELQNVLIGRGYSMKNEAEIPADVLKLARITSGFDQATINYELAKIRLRDATLVAPFDGFVANLSLKEYNQPDGVFCTLVDLKDPEVNFCILENELSLIQSGDIVFVSPFSDMDNMYKGNIREINPMVDKSGMVAVKAVLNGVQQRLYEGMNVRVRVQRATGKQLMIPKSALVLRNNRKVVFTCKNGLAQWAYIQTGLENSENLVVTEGLQEGDSVIYEGNINLAHESPIVVR